MLNPAYRFSPLPTDTEQHAKHGDVVLLYCAKAHGELDDAHLHRTEQAVLAKRKKTQAQQEYRATRWAIKQLARQLYPQYRDYPLAAWCSEFDVEQAQLILSIDGHPLDARVVISHAHGHIAVAMTRGTALLGVDIEKIDNARAFEKLAAHYYPAAETRDIGRDVETFFRVWTLKEAYAKATKQPIATLLGQPILELIGALDGQVYCQELFAGHFDISLITDPQRPVLTVNLPAAVDE